MIKGKELEKTLKTLPQAPGIYKMIDKEGRVIYIGKANNISKRVKQYFKKYGEEVKLADERFLSL